MVLVWKDQKTKPHLIGFYDTSKDVEEAKTWLRKRFELEARSDCYGGFSIDHAMSMLDEAMEWDSDKPVNVGMVIFEGTMRGGIDGKYEDTTILVMAAIGQLSRADTGERLAFTEICIAGGSGIPYMLKTLNVGNLVPSGTVQ